MVFKRRDRRPIWKVVVDFIYPRGGWTRAATYVKYRLRRLPDTPEKISRGVWAGVFAAFTPFYGMHFLVAFILARLMRGNVIAALMATFFGNPLTYVPIGVAALWTGHWLLGRIEDREITIINLVVALISAMVALHLVVNAEDIAGVRAAALTIATDIHPVNNLRVIARLKSMGHRQEEAVAWMNHWMTRGFEAFEQLILPDTPFCFGSAPGLADLCLIPQLYNAHRWGVSLETMQCIRAVETACAERDEFRKAYPTESTHEPDTSHA